MLCPSQNLQWPRFLIDRNAGVSAPISTKASYCLTTSTVPSTTSPTLKAAAPFRCFPRMVTWISLVSSFKTRTMSFCPNTKTSSANAGRCSEIWRACRNAGFLKPTSSIAPHKLNSSTVPVKVCPIVHQGILYRGPVNFSIPLSNMPLEEIFAIVALTNSPSSKLAPRSLSRGSRACFSPPMSTKMPCKGEAPTTGPFTSWPTVKLEAPFKC
mmetsp:Transcript_71614/g.232851  ORF Transcript_71614/g.232851 Transcript_71614/m.232851 type:complete len:212 (-) Transcript_71614:1434-2069(-)